MVGGSFLNIKKLVDTKKLHLLAKPFKEAVRVLEGACHVCRPQRGPGACKCLWSLKKKKRQDKQSAHKTFL